MFFLSQPQVWHFDASGHNQKATLLGRAFDARAPSFIITNIETLKCSSCGAKSELHNGDDQKAKGHEIGPSIETLHCFILLVLSAHLDGLSANADSCDASIRMLALCHSLC